MTSSFSQPVVSHEALNNGTLGTLRIIHSVLSSASSLFWTATSYFTMYGELSSAQEDKDFQHVRMRLQNEWLCIGAILIQLVTIDATIFSISPDATLKIRSSAYLAVVISIISSGLGIVCVIWFHLRYQWIAIETFIIRSRDIYGTYFFFSLSSRVPAFCISISVVSLMTFLGIVAHDTWPEVVILGIIVVIVMFLQFLIYAVHLLTAHVTRGFSRVADTAHAVVSTAAENV